MLLNRDVFHTDPDAYRIANQGVAKISFPPSPAARETLRGELETFVCDGHYADGLAKILSAFLQTAGRGTAPAAWISGFFGSGKSHLANMLAALWTNLELPGGVTARGLVVDLPGEIAGSLKELDTLARRLGVGRLAAGDTLGTGSPDPVESALCILLRAAGLPDDPRAARVALWLADEGVLDAVRGRLGGGFDRHVRNYAISTDFAAAVLAAKPGLARGPDELGERLAAQFPAEARALDAGEMVRVARQALTLGGRELPLTLLVLDEVQQFLNQRPEAALRIQTLAERLAGEFDGRVLLVCTGQQALADVDSLQKLLGRFPVQVALGGADIDSVVRKTVLRKRASAEGHVRAMLAGHAGEVSRHLHGSRVAHTANDESDAVLDWPLLPSRRRFWDLVLNALDKTGRNSVLRGQLATSLAAARRQASKPLGSAVPADFFYDRIENEAANLDLLARETRDRIDKLRAGGGDDLLKARILAVVYLVGRIGEGAGWHGVRPKPETIADLLVEDLAGEPDLRRKVPELIEALREGGAVIEIDGEWRLQTKVSAEWDQAYRSAVQERKGDEAGLSEARREALGAEIARVLAGVDKVPHGGVGSRVIRRIHRLAPDDKAPADGIVLRVHDGWQADISSVEKAIAAAPTSDPTLHLLVPSRRTNDLRRALVERAAARSVIDRKGVPGTAEGEEARRAMESREAVAHRLAREIAAEAVAGARVVQAGGSVAGGPLDQAVRTAATNALARLYPRFGEAEDERWGAVFDRAHKRRDPDAIKAVDHVGAPETHPVCRAILQHLGPGRKGSEVRAHFDAPPFGWPKDAIEGALVVLDNAGQLRVTGEDGRAAALADLPRPKIGLCTFRPETTVVSVGDKIAARGLLTAAGVAHERDQEVLALSALLDRLQVAAREAGGDAPAPTPASVPDGAALAALSGNALLKALAERANDLKAALEGWRTVRARIDQRLPAWRLAERLVALGAREQAGELDAVRAGRALLAEPDPVPPIVQAAAEALRSRLNAAWGAWQDASGRAEARLRADPLWERLTPEQRRTIRQNHGLLAAEEPKVATPQDVAASLERRGLAGWADLAKALPTRADEALAEAALLLEPKARLFPLPGGTLKDEAELDAWLADLRARLAAALADGPVILKA